MQLGGFNVPDGVAIDKSGDLLYFLSRHLTTAFRNFHHQEHI